MSLPTDLPKGRARHLFDETFGVVGIHDRLCKFFDDLLVCCPVEQLRQDPRSSGTEFSGCELAQHMRLPLATALLDTLRPAILQTVFVPAGSGTSAYRGPNPRQAGADP